MRSGGGVRVWKPAFSYGDIGQRSVAAAGIVTHDRIKFGKRLHKAGRLGGAGRSCRGNFVDNIRICEWKTDIRKRQFL